MKPSCDGPAAGPGAGTGRGPAEGEGPAPVWSSKVPFYPPSDKYWRIGRKWYDFSEFLDKHPGGRQVLLLARDRFEDATFAFEAHHHNYAYTRKIISKYEVPAETALASLRRRPKRGDAGPVGPTPVHHDAELDAGTTPLLLDDDAFYSVLRRRVTAHLRSVGCRGGGPTTECIVVFWGVFAGWAALMYLTWATGSLLVSLVAGLFGSWLGAFGHNWVHQPKYKRWGWAILSLDVLGFSSEGWYREHVLQHHMYTNTPWDNHFRGTEPFLVTDPTVPRGWLARCVMPYINPVVLCFGVYGNYMFHLVSLLKGEEEPSVGKVCLPLHFAAMISRWGVAHGVALTFAFHAVIGLYYFTLALMNHNAEHCVDVKTRNQAKDWAEAQLHSSADWGVNLSFRQAFIYLWLNYHTVHHLFPLVDFSHHPAIQAIMMETCKEHKIRYVTSDPVRIYREMVRSFSTPASLLREITVYSGGL